MINEAIELANEDALAKPPPGICVRATRGPTAPVVNPRRPAGDYSDFAVLGDGHCYVCGEGETRFIANHSVQRRRAWALVLELPARRGEIQGMADGSPAQGRPGGQNASCQ